MSGDHEDRTPRGDARGLERNQSGPGGLDSGAEANLRAQDEDVQRMLAFCGGDAAAFDAIYSRWSAPLLRYLQRMVRDTAVAEELVQEVFLRVYRARDRYAPEARLSTWLYRIATNLALNELRRPRHRSPHFSADAEGSPELVAERPAIDEVVDARRLGYSVDAELENLPERQRAALVLSAVDGLSYAEVASALEVSEKAVKALVHRARVTLAKRLQGALPAGRQTRSPQAGADASRPGK